MPHSSKLCYRDQLTPPWFDIELCRWTTHIHTCSSKDLGRQTTPLPSEPGAIRSWLMLLIWIKCLMDSEPCASFSKQCIIISFILWRKARQRRVEICLDAGLPVFVHLQVTRLTRLLIIELRQFFFFLCWLPGISSDSQTDGQPRGRISCLFLVINLCLVKDTVS